MLQVDPRLTLSDITIAELVPGRRQAVSLGRWTERTSALPVAESTPRIVRRLPSIWRLRLQPGQELSSLKVQYELIAPDGRRGRLAAAGTEGSEVRAELVEIPPLVVAVDERGTVVEGGAVLVLDVAEVREAGRYAATLAVTLNQF